MIGEHGYGILIGDFNKWVVRISTIIDWIRDTFKMRVGVHGLKYLEHFNGFLASIILIFNIMDGFLIFEYTELSIFIPYEIVDVYIDEIWIVPYDRFIRLMFISMRFGFDHS